MKIVWQKHIGRIALGLGLGAAALATVAPAQQNTTIKIWANMVSQAPSIQISKVLDPQIHASGIQPCRV